MYKAMDLANYIVKKCYDDGIPISNLQLQKILYFIQAKYLRINQLAFFEKIEAWQFGPVIPEVYYNFCGFGSMPITFAFPDSTDIQNMDKKIIDPIIERKRKLQPWDLVEETHKSGGAWDKTYNNGKGNHSIIPLDLIKEAG